MAISDNYVPLRQLGNGSTTQFSSNWDMVNAAYAAVFLESIATGVQTPQTQGVDYTLVFTSAGFTVTFIVAPPNTVYAVVGRDVSIDQTDPYTTSKGYQGATLEDSLDKLTAISQDLRDITNRSIAAPLGDPATNLILPSVALRAGRIPAFDSSGNVTVSDQTLAQIVSGSSSAAASAVAAASSASAASSSASSAGTSATSAASSAAAAAASAAGFDIIGPCRVATTVALTATYANGASGVGATLTNSGTQIALSIDGVALAVGNRVLVKNQAAPAQNGVYSVTNIGSGVTNWVLTRTTDYNTPAQIVEGTATIIEEGTSFAESMWIMTTSGAVVIGTTAINFSGLVGIVNNNSVTNAKLATMGPNTVKANLTAGTTNPTDITLSSSTFIGMNSSGVSGVIPFAQATPIYCSNIAYNLATASGNVTTTGLVDKLGNPFTPKAFKFFGNVNGTNQYFQGQDDLVVSSSVVQVGTIYSIDGSNSIDLVVSGGNQVVGKVSAVAAGQFTIAFTKVGAPTGTLTIYFMAFG